jgi:hypothetical protein
VLVELARAGGVRVLGLLTADSPAVRIGDRVAGVVEQPSNADWPLLRWRAS